MNPKDPKEPFQPFQPKPFRPEPAPPVEPVQEPKSPPQSPLNAPTNPPPVWREPQPPNPTQTPTNPPPTGPFRPADVKPVVEKPAVAPKPKAEKKGKRADDHYAADELHDLVNVLIAVVLHKYPSHAWKTRLNEKGELQKGWFIAGLTTEFGRITFHMPEEWWDRLSGVPEVERDLEYDGYTSKDVADRLLLLSRSAN